MEQLLKDGKVHRGQLGVNIQNITDDVAKSLDLKDTKGVLVSNVRAGSAAEKPESNAATSSRQSMAKKSKTEMFSATKLPQLCPELT